MKLKLIREIQDTVATLGDPRTVTDTQYNSNVLEWTTETRLPEAKEKGLIGDEIEVA